MPTLEALRQDEDRARLAAETNREARKVQRYDALKEGDLAAVTRNGVTRINPEKIGGAQRQLAEAAGRDYIAAPICIW